MNKIELLNEIKNIMQRDEDITVDMKVSNLPEWDSLSIMSIVALYEEKFHKTFQYKDIQEVNTLDDLINLVSDKLDQI